MTTYHDRYEPQPRNRGPLARPLGRYHACPHDLTPIAALLERPPWNKATVHLADHDDDDDGDETTGLVITTATVSAVDIGRLLRHTDVRNVGGDTEDLGGLFAQLNVPVDRYDVVMSTQQAGTPVQHGHLPLAADDGDDWMLAGTWERLQRLLTDLDAFEGDAYACLVAPLPIEAYDPATVASSIATPPTPIHGAAAAAVRTLCERWTAELVPDSLPIELDDDGDAIEVAMEPLADLQHVAHTWGLNAVEALCARVLAGLLAASPPALLCRLTGFPDDLTPPQKQHLAHEAAIVTDPAPG